MVSIDDYYLDAFGVRPEEFTTDKVQQGYLIPYLALLTDLALTFEPLPPLSWPEETRQPDVIVELGVRDGSSLRMWRTLCPHAVIVGIDNNEQSTWPDIPGIQKIVLDQGDERLPTWILANSQDIQPKLIVDDCSHQGELTQRSLELLWPILAPGGAYVIEDWYVGFGTWPSYNQSMLVLAHDLINHLQDATDEIEQITYRYGMIIIRKRGNS